MSNCAAHENFQSRSIAISRILAAFLIVAFHAIVYIPDNQKLSILQFLLPPIPFFFFFAGYFSKQSEIRSVAKRVFLLACMLAFWELVCLLIVTPETISHRLPLHLLTRIQTHFINYPLWFLRHLIVLTVLTIALARMRRYNLGLATLILFLSELGAFDKLISESVSRWIDMRSLPFFLLGFSLQSIKLQSIENFLKQWYLYIIFLYVAFCAAIQLLEPSADTTYQQIPVASLAGIFFLCAVGTLVQKLLPRISNILYNLSECSFLVFACHVPLLFITTRHFNFSPIHNINIWLLAIIWPLVSIIFAKLLIILLRKVAPWLLPYVAGLKK